MSIVQAHRIRYLSCGNINCGHNSQHSRCPLPLWSLSIYSSLDIPCRKYKRQIRSLRAAMPGNYKLRVQLSIRGDHGHSSDITHQCQARTWLYHPGTTSSLDCAFQATSNCESVTMSEQRSCLLSFSLLHHYSSRRHSRSLYSPAVLSQSHELVNAG
ncbi:hypothetical protein BJ165DRAFT_575666 [Panaeolus papilionaceus]|nr:hypothetical protein BJ165DRAFT_575666 [Panaeolus papilionaceus]